jgi:UDP:flavonoid glycosyltransferase YjiC (YdhE family)
VEKLDRPILITGGTAVWNHAGQFYKLAAEACNLLGRTAIVICRHEGMIPQPVAEETLYYKRLPFASLVPRVSAIIHHGGTSVLVRALASSVPQVALPFGGDRPDTSSRLERLGVCVKVPFVRWSAESVAAALSEALTSERVASACSRIRARIDESSGLSDGCRAVEALAQNAYSET